MSDVWERKKVVWTEQDTGELPSCAHAHVMRVGDWRCGPIYHIDLGRPHWYSLRCGISTLTQSEAINWVVSLILFPLWEGPSYISYGWPCTTALVLRLSEKGECSGRTQLLWVSHMRDSIPWRCILLFERCDGRGACWWRWSSPWVFWACGKRARY